MTLRWIAPCLLAIAATGCFYGSVVRVVDGMEVPGRFVSDVAYAAYTRGAELEAREQFDAALLAYSEASAHDPDSAEVWTRVAAMRCRLNKVAASDAAFAEAEDLAASYEPLWRARALCAEQRGELAGAIKYARLAVAIDPQRDETVLLYARLVGSKGDAAEASRWLRALSLRSPYSREVWLAVVARARADGDDAWFAHARSRLEALAEREGRDAGLANESLWNPVDAALIGGDLQVARKRIRAARLDPRLLPARAIALGRPALAQSDAALRVGADPLDSDARVALALATDLLGEGAEAGEMMAKLPHEAEPLSEVGSLMLAELLSRHVGRGASSASLSHHATTRLPLEHIAARDALSDLTARLRARLDAAPKIGPKTGTRP